MPDLMTHSTTILMHLHRICPTILCLPRLPQLFTGPVKVSLGDSDVAFFPEWISHPTNSVTLDLSLSRVEETLPT